MTPRRSSESTMPPSRRPSFAFAVAALLLLALLPAGYYAFLARPAEPPPVVPQDAAEAGDAAAAQVAPAPELRIAEVEGLVEIQRSGGFVPVEVGALLGQDDTLRTGDGRARLVAPDAYEVQVEPGTLFEVAALQPKLASLRLGLGMVFAKVQPGGGTRLEVAAKDSDARAATSDGSFSMSNNGGGTVAVGARTGAVEFSAAGRAVILRAGQQSIARGGAAPEAPVAIPSSVFLKVDWPSPRGVINARKVTVSGRTTPGAILVIDGQAIRVDADGKFSAPVLLREGKNVVQARSLDLGDHQARSQSEIVVDTTAPKSDISTNNLWKN